jgi:lipid II:glycine glycyltransferase (peptidoglycan interpeptide bridge formation enzyme)
VAALLLFYLNKVVEYFTPVVDVQYRTLQPLSLLIHHAMLDAISRGCRWWNWGGTWAEQEGVYRFKKRWGTNDYPYKYFTSVYDPTVLSLPPRQLLHEYPYFYVFPFAAAISDAA